MRARGRSISGKEREREKERGRQRDSGRKKEVKSGIRKYIVSGKGGGRDVRCGTWMLGGA